MWTTSQIAEIVAHVFPREWECPRTVCDCAGSSTLHPSLALCRCGCLWHGERHVCLHARLPLSTYVANVLYDMVRPGESGECLRLWLELVVVNVQRMVPQPTKCALHHVVIGTLFLVLKLCEDELHLAHMRRSLQALNHCCVGLDPRVMNDLQHAVFGMLGAHVVGRVSRKRALEE